MPHAVLCQVARNLSAGRPLIALLWTNRYLDTHSPLRRALSRKAMERIAQRPKLYAKASEAISRLESGDTLDELEQELRCSALAIRERGTAGNRGGYTFSPRRRWHMNAGSGIRRAVSAEKRRRYTGYDGIEAGHFCAYVNISPNIS